MTDEQDNTSRDRFGEISAAVGILLYVVLIVFLVLPLPRWIDTFLSISLLTAPFIVGSIIYALIERRGGWSPSRRLK